MISETDDGIQGVAQFVAQERSCPSPRPPSNSAAIADALGHRGRRTSSKRRQSGGSAAGRAFGPAPSRTAPKVGAKIGPDKADFKRLGACSFKVPAPGEEDDAWPGRSWAARPQRPVTQQRRRPQPSSADRRKGEAGPEAPTSSSSGTAGVVPTGYLVTYAGGRCAQRKPLHTWGDPQGPYQQTPGAPSGLSTARTTRDVPDVNSLLRRGGPDAWRGPGVGGFGGLEVSSAVSATRLLAGKGHQDRVVGPGVNVTDDGGRHRVRQGGDAGEPTPAAP